MPEVRTTFDTLLDAFRDDHGSRSISARPAPGAGPGQKVDVRFDKDVAQGFAFIPTAEWLLFYVRKPELKHGRLSLATVRKAFSDAEMNPSGEIIFRIRSRAEAFHAAALICS
ncbi:hypothetical protein [Rhodosalinus sp.]|uniref:hypothetical protein n=1 Tax=Rhodosalinus sp. TaxID=2047741 RepID=UPI003569ABA9